MLVLYLAPTLVEKNVGNVSNSHAEIIDSIGVSAFYFCHKDKLARASDKATADRVCGIVPGSVPSWLSTSFVNVGMITIPTRDTSTLATGPARAL